MTHASTPGKNGLALDYNPLFFEGGTDAIAKVALQLDPIVRDGSAAPTSLFQIATESFQELRIVWQPVDDRNRLAASALLFHPQLRDRPIRNRLPAFFERLAALAIR